MGYLTWWSFPKKAWLIILGELCVIASLSLSLYATYLNDVYFQSYANSLSPILVPTLSVAFGLSSASIAAYLYIGIKRMQMEKKAESPLNKKGSHSTRDSIEVNRESGSPSRNDTPPQQTRSRLKPIVPSNGHVRSKPHPKGSDNQSSMVDTKKQT